jgi:hypothetical protein
MQRRIIIALGAIAAALAGLDVGAATRPAAPRAGWTHGPRMDFDLAAHTLPPAVSGATQREAPAGDG